MNAPLGRVGGEALAATFVDSESSALIINAIVFAAAFVLVLALPRKPRETAAESLDAAA